jgi:hypothetical protein
MDARKRDIYAGHVLRLQQLSECSCPRSAFIVGESGRLVETISKNLIPFSLYSSSPVIEAILKYGYDTEGTIFCSDFPSLDEFMTLFLTKIRTVYYFGDIKDEKAVMFLNKHTGTYPENGFEIIKLEL